MKSRVSRMLMRVDCLVCESSTFLQLAAPFAIEHAATCPLVWLLERRGASEPDLHVDFLEGRTVPHAGVA